MTTTTVADWPFHTRADWGRVMDDRLRAVGITRKHAAAEMRISEATLRRKLAGRSPIYLHDLAAVAEFTRIDVIAMIDQAAKAWAEAGR